MAGESRQVNKSAIRNFAIEARKILMKSAETEAGFYGISKEEIKAPVQKGPDFEVYESIAGTQRRIYSADMRRRAALVSAVREKGFDNVIEETAYTWFNRLIAIRFMEVNNYLPFRMRVLSSDSGSVTPDIVSRSLEVDLGLEEAELDAVQKAKETNQYDESFRLLFIKACNVLNESLPGLFEKTDDYMELLLKLPYTSDGVVRMLVDTIPENNFNVNEGGQLEIIGWLYQYYNTEPKARAFAKKGKITKEEIPAVTQLFTPDWIVRYMVENSLGRLWIEHLLANGDSRSEQEIANDFGWKYYLPEAEQEPEVQAQLVQIRAERKDLTPEDILCIDPCQGSGHILVYLFEVLMQIYREDGYSERDAAKSILEHNLYGLDIDDRAYQLSYFAVLMKARQYNRLILKNHVKPHVYSIQESNTVNRGQIKFFGVDMSEAEKKTAARQLTGLLDTFKDAKEYGSILNVEPYDWDLLRRFVENDAGQYEFEALGIDKTQAKIMPLLEIGEAMAQKYHVVATNPPYMGTKGMNPKLSSYLKSNYAKTKSDLFAVFIEKAFNLNKRNGFSALITQRTWLFLAAFEELRKWLGNVTSGISFVELGAGAFSEISGEVVQTIAFVVKKDRIKNYVSLYKNLSGVNNKETAYIEEDSKRIVLDDFKHIPGEVFAMKLSQAALSAYSTNKYIKDVAIPKKGMITSDNNRFLKLWFEIPQSNIQFGMNKIEEQTEGVRWVPYNKGGSYRKWYGNHDYLINWENDGREVKSYAAELYGSYSRQIMNERYYFKDAISWSYISAQKIGIRYYPPGFVFDTAGPSLFIDDRRDRFLIMGLLSSCVSEYYIRAINPTINLFASDIANIPYIATDDNIASRVLELVDSSIRLSQSEWDDFETSWGFKEHPLIDKAGYIRDGFERWTKKCNDRFEKMKANEEALNTIYINLYKLDNELDPNIDDKDITVRRADLRRDMKSLISYAVGCMFGRYSLDVDGLAYAGGDWKEAYGTKYKTFLPDEDAIIPITDEEYFKDDIVARFVEFVRVVYGDETLEENLKFIAEALGNKGDTPRAVIRNYFLNDFYKDHCNTYSVTGSGKRPIYWLFDSGKQNGFKALIYIHRYTPDTVGLIRSVYLHNAQTAIQNALQNSEYIISSTTSATERARETRKRDKYVKQLNELRPYYQAISHIALQRIPMDLDDGVKKNYQLFQGVEISTEGKKKQTIDLLAKL